MHRLLLTAAVFLALLAPSYARQMVFMDFEGDGFGEWQVRGEAFGKAPSAGGPGRMHDKAPGFANDSFACSFHGEDAATGELLSPPFTVEFPHLSFLIGGGPHETTAIQLLVDGQVVRATSGLGDNTLRPRTWNVTEFRGKEARIRIIDDHTGAWGFISIDHILFSDSANPKFPAATRDGKPHAAGLKQSSVLGGALIPENSEARIFASHDRQQVVSPTALCFDREGDVLITETHRFRFGVQDSRAHLYRLHEDLAVQTVADRRAMHEKWAARVPLASMTEKTEIIRLLADRDGDGTAEVSQVYADGFKDVVDGPAAGIFHYEGTTYLACIPNIWILRDTNGDGVADERKVLQDGLGVRVSFSGHDLNGFALGPDGRLYGTIGDRGLNLTTKEGREYQLPNQGAIFRFDPDGSNFEVVHTGLRNPKEIAFDKWGNGISVDNNSDQGDKARVVYLVEGADSGWRMGHQILSSFHATVGLAERPINQWMDERQWEPENDAQPAYILPPVSNLTSGPSGLAYQPGTGFDELCRDSFLICDYRGGAASSGIWAFEVEPEGAGMSVVAPRTFNWGAAVTDVDFGYDGKLYVTDFIGGWESHNDGRVYSLTSSKEDPNVAQVQDLIRTGLRGREARELAMLMDHPDMRIRTRAHVALADLPEAVSTFENILNSSSSPLHRLHATWGLWVRARRHEDAPATELLVRLLGDEETEVRAQAARSLGEAPLEDTAPLRKALKDESLRVRAFAALSLSRLQDHSAREDVIALLAENANADRYLRHAGIMGLLGCATASEIADLESHPSAAVRLAAVVALRRLEDPALVQFLDDAEPEVADEAICALNDVPVEEGRPHLARLLDNYAPRGNGRALTPMQMRRLMNSAFRLGTPESAQRLLLVAQNDAIAMNERLEALRLLSVWENPPLVDQSIGRYLPLAPRDGSEIRPALEAEIPKLLGQGDVISAPAIALATQYKLPAEILDDQALKRVARAQNRSEAVRLRALDLLASRNAEGLVPMLEEFAKARQPDLAGRALELLVAAEPAKGYEAVKEALTSGPVPKRKRAWTILAGLDHPGAAAEITQGLSQLSSNAISASLALEVIEAAEASKDPAVAAALQSYWESLAADDPLARWRMCLAGGDPEAGSKIFASNPKGQCTRCHKFETGHAKGGDAGPNLAGIGGKHDAAYLLESIINPSAEVAPGYGFSSVTFKNGATLTGTVHNDGEETLDLLVSDAFWRIKKSDVQDVSTPISAMPPMAALLTRQEVRDLVAWLQTLRDKPVDLTLPEPTPLDPATLKAPEAATQTTEPEPVKNEPSASAESSAAPSPPAAPAPAPASSRPPAKTSGNNPIGVVLVLAWVGLCLLPMIAGVRNR